MCTQENAVFPKLRTGKSHYYSQTITVKLVSGSTVVNTTASINSNVSGVLTASISPTTSAGEHTVTLTTTYGQNAPTGYVTVTLTYNGVNYTKVISVSSVEQGKYLGLATAISGATVTIDSSSTPVKAGTVSSGSNTATLGDYVVWKSATTSSYTKTCCYTYVCTASGTYSWVQDKSDTANMNALSDITSIIKSTDANTIALLLVQRLAANTAFIGTLFTQYISVSGGIAVGGRYNTNGTLANKNSDGVYLGASGLKGRIIGEGTNFLAGAGAGDRLADGSENNIAIGVDALTPTTSDEYSYDADDNIAIGAMALSGRTSWVVNNIAIGRDALRFTNGTGSGRVEENIAIGVSAGKSMLGQYNILIGSNTVSNQNAYSIRNICIGYAAGQNITNGSDNICVGYNAAQSITLATKNIAIGVNALNKTTTGYSNVAIGYQALVNNTTGMENIAIGVNAIGSSAMTSASRNIGIGNTLLALTTGLDNIAIGNGSLISTTNGAYNIAIGRNAGNGNTTGNRNIYIGQNVQFNGGSVTGSDNIIIGSGINLPSTTESYQIVIGSTSRRIALTSSGFVYYKSATVSQQIARASVSNNVLTIYIGA